MIVSSELSIVVSCPYCRQNDPNKYIHVNVVMPLGSIEVQKKVFDLKTKRYKCHYGHTFFLEDK